MNKPRITRIDVIDGVQIWRCTHEVDGVAVSGMSTSPAGAYARMQHVQRMQQALARGEEDEAKRLSYRAQQLPDVICKAERKHVLGMPA